MIQQPPPLIAYRVRRKGFWYPCDIVGLDPRNGRWVRQFSCTTTFAGEYLRSLGLNPDDVPGYKEAVALDKTSDIAGD